MFKDNSRRNFLKNISMASITFTGLPSLRVFAEVDDTTYFKNNHLVFLFQGDSITDGNRGRNTDPNHILGHGYAFSIASKVGASFPELQNTFFNRGISGNKITDLAARWQKDTLDIQPDILSILIGVNDTGSVVNQKNMVTVEQYEAAYRSLLIKTKETLPYCMLVLCEPFILPNEKLNANWNTWNDDIQKRQDVVRRLAIEFNTVLVPLQKVFTDASNLASENYWIWDGVHPTYSGHALITKAWLKAVGKRLQFLNKTSF